MWQGHNYMKIKSMKIASLLLLLNFQFALAEMPNPVIHGDRKIAKVALTFDACPTIPQGQLEVRVLEILKKTKTPASLFISGRWAKKQKSLVKQLGKNPLFEIANHSYSHPHFLEKTDEEVKWELEETQKILKSITGKIPKLYRPPFGEFNENTVKIAKEVGLITVEYDLPSGDPDPTFTKEVLADSVVKKARNGSIVVMHMNTRGIYTGEALEEIITGLRKRGFTLVKVSDLF